MRSSSALFRTIALSRSTWMAIESHEPVEIEGTLLGIPEPASGGSFMTLRTERLIFKGIARSVSGNVRLFAPQFDALAAEEYDRLDLGYGSQVRIACRLDREERFLNPGVASGIEI